MPPCAYLSLRSLHHACLIFHNFKGHQVRHVMIEGEPWFVAADVCECLGFPLRKGITNTSHYTRYLDAAERYNANRGQVEFSPLFASSPAALIALIAESGLYKLIFRAQRARPEVAAFQDWVTREVLPAIRKTGGYLLNEEARETAAADQRDEMPIPQTYPAACWAEYF